MPGERHRQNQKAQRKQPQTDGAPLSVLVGRADLASPDILDIAVRAYAERSGKKARAWRAKSRVAPPSVWTLILDTETTVDASQRLRFGTYEIRERNELAERISKLDRDRVILPL